MHQPRQNFLYWDNLDQALQPPPDQIGDEVESTRYYLSTRYRQVINKNHLLTLRGMYFWNRFQDNIAVGGGNRSTSRNLNGEIQMASQFEHVAVTMGLEGTDNIVDSNIFGEHSGYTLAGYGQVEVEIIDNLRVSLGGRGDLF